MFFIFFETQSLAGQTTEFDLQRYRLDESHLLEAKERSLLIREKVKTFCKTHGHLKSLQLSFEDAFLLVDKVHQLAFCRHAKVDLMD